MVSTMATTNSTVTSQWVPIIVIATPTGIISSVRRALSFKRIGSGFKSRYSRWPGHYYNVGYSARLKISFQLNPLTKGKQRTFPFFHRDITNEPCNINVWCQPCDLHPQNIYTSTSISHQCRPYFGINKVLIKTETYLSQNHRWSKC